MAVNGVAMTVFCWHMTALLPAIATWDLLGGTLATEPTTGWWALRPVWLVLPAVFLVPFVLVLGPGERPREDGRRVRDHGVARRAARHRP